MVSDRPAGSQVGLAWEFVRVPLWALLLSVAVGAVNGLIFGAVVLGPAAASPDVTVGDILVGAPGYGAMVGISLSPLALMAIAAVVAVRRGRDVRTAVAVLTSIALVVGAGFWLAVGYDFVPNELETPSWLFVLAAVVGGAAAVGFVWATGTRVLVRSSPDGADQELPTVGTDQ